MGGTGTLRSTTASFAELAKASYASCVEGTYLIGTNVGEHLRLLLLHDAPRDLRAFFQQQAPSSSKRRLQEGAEEKAHQVKVSRTMPTSSDDDDVATEYF